MAPSPRIDDMQPPRPGFSGDEAEAMRRVATPARQPIGRHPRGAALPFDRHQNARSPDSTGVASRGMAAVWHGVGQAGRSGRHGRSDRYVTRVEHHSGVNVDVHNIMHPRGFNGVVHIANVNDDRAGVKPRLICEPFAH
jgi:hypothetical protein